MLAFRPHAARPAHPTNTFSFCGSVTTVDDDWLVGIVEGVLFQGFEEGESSLQGRVRWKGPFNRRLYPGDTVFLKPDGLEGLRIDIMEVGAAGFAFRCCPDECGNG